MAQRLTGALALVMAAALPLCAAAQTAAALRREIEAVGVVERLGAEVPRGGAFAAADGSTFRFEAIAGRPALLSFNYTSCPKLCGLQLSALAKALHDLGWEGDGFSVVTVSVDPAEKPAQLRAYASAFVRQAGGSAGIALGWRFLRGDKPTIDALAEAVGFKYRYDPRSGEFAHQATLVVLTGEGRVSSYLHGVTFEPEALRSALDRARRGAVATSAEQASLGGYLLSCMGFDPADPAPLALRITRVSGVAILLCLASFLAVQIVRELRRHRSGARRVPAP